MLGLYYGTIEVILGLYWGYIRGILGNMVKRLRVLRTSRHVQFKSMH